jgi:hypothetical protein
MICRAYDFVAELTSSCSSCCYDTMVVPIHEKIKKFMEQIRISIYSFVELSKNIFINRVTITIVQEANKISNIAFSTLNPTKYLFRAVLDNNLDLAKACLEKPISDNDLRLSFNDAVLKGHLEIVRIILTKSTKIGIWQRGLYDAAKKGHLDIVKEILSNQSLNLNELDNDEFRLAVMEAYKNNHIEMVREILKCSRISEKTIEEIFILSASQNLLLLIKEIFSARSISDEIIDRGILSPVNKGHQSIVEEIILQNREPVLRNLIDTVLVFGKDPTFVKAILQKILEVNTDVIPDYCRFLYCMLRFFQKYNFDDRGGVREFKEFLSEKNKARHSRDTNQEAYLRFLALNLE